MDLDLLNLNCDDLCSDNDWDFSKLSLLFGSDVNVFNSKLGKVDYASSNMWVWVPKSRNISITSSVYHFLNNRGSDPIHWNGWRYLWSLKLIPRVKYFLWLTFLGRLSTSDYLHAINLGPHNMCIFCNLYPESPEHIFHTCSKSQCVWATLFNLTGSQFLFSNGFSSGDWISQSMYSMRIKIIIAYAAWFLWKARCDAIFRNSRPNFIFIAHKALSYANQSSFAYGNYNCRHLILSNFVSSDGLFLFIATSWNDQTQVGFGGFFISSFNYVIVFAGCLP